jgi:hypothetical protein
MAEQGSARAWSARHAVLFYDTEAYRGATAARFLADGIRAGQPIIVVATEAHRNAIARELRTQGIAVEELREGRDVLWLDAWESLAALMEDTRINRVVFEATAGNMLELLVRGRRGVVPRVYGEMVNLLWRRGNIDAALQLEALWNDLASKYAFDLMCTYENDPAFKHGQRGVHSRLCALHSDVVVQPSPV